MKGRSKLMILTFSIGFPSYDPKNGQCYWINFNHNFNMNVTIQLYNNNPYNYNTIQCYDLPDLSH